MEPVVRKTVHREVQHSVPHIKTSLPDYEELETKPLTIEEKYKLLKEVRDIFKKAKEEGTFVPYEKNYPAGYEDYLDAISKERA